MSVFRLVMTMCVAEILGMLSMFTFSALLPDFITEWNLTHTEAGWLSAVFLGGYAVSVPILAGMTDRINTRPVYLSSTALGAAAALGFAFFAQGFWTALLFRMLSGLSLAGTYMPGLKALSDQVEGPRQPRVVAFYTSSFGVGTALSFFVAGLVNTWLNWQWAFAVGALGSITAFLIAAWVLPRSTKLHASRPATALLDFRPVLRNRSSVAYILCYAAHNWELFGIRSWVVALLVFTQAKHGNQSLALAPTVVATLMVLLGVGASITGNELSMRFGRRRVISTLMLMSATVSCLVGFGSALSYGTVVALCLLNGVTAASESASITAGAIGTATPGYRGTTMALHSTVGFSFAFMGPLTFGWLLDQAGAQSPLGWGLAFASLGAVMVAGSVALVWLKPDELPGDRLDHHP